MSNAHIYHISYKMRQILWNALLHTNLRPSILINIAHFKEYTRALHNYNYKIAKTQGVFSFRKRQNTNNNKKYKDAQI
jgi:hypothetical protein